jgi:hypothetical protein
LTTGIDVGYVGEVHNEQTFINEISFELVQNYKNVNGETLPEFSKGCWSK